jgi:hypothetical protein
MLAMIVMTTHPKPVRIIMMPYMHPNITQICRFWEAATLLFDYNNLPHIPSLLNSTIANLKPL